eukprot:INCI15790.4.p1 GENE.INCI15790.4~~INCI15790.4.p1  ORF type:complete len:364 (+),score=51.14 INCI15790.4:660-1751(+)
MACSVMDAVSHEDFWAHVTGGSSRSNDSSDVPATLRTFQMFASLMQALTSSSRLSTSVTFKLLGAWQDLHKRLLPQIPSNLRLLGPAGQEAALRMVQDWKQSLVEPFTHAYNVSLDKHQYKALVGCANPERRDTVGLWDKMRKFTATALLNAVSTVQDCLDQVAQVFGSAGSSNTTRLERQRVETGVEVILKTLYAPLALREWKQVGSFALPAQISILGPLTRLGMVEDAVAKLLLAVVPSIVDFKHADPRWFTHDQRLGILQSILTVINRANVSPELGDRLSLIFSSELLRLENTDVRFALTEVEGGRGQFLIRLGRKTITKASQLLHEALDCLLQTMIRRLPIEAASTLAGTLDPRNRYMY